MRGVSAVPLASIGGNGVLMYGRSPRWSIEHILPSFEVIGGAAHMLLGGGIMPNHRHPSSYCSRRLMFASQVARYRFMISLRKVFVNKKVPRDLLSRGACELP